MRDSFFVQQSQKLLKTMFADDFWASCSKTKNQAFNVMNQAKVIAILLFMGSTLCGLTLQANSPYFPETPHLNTDLTNASGELIFSSKVPEATKQEMKSDLHTLFVIRASQGSKLQQKIFQGFGGKSYQHYFLSLVDHVEYDSEEQDGTLAYVAFDLFKMYITPYYLNSNMPLMARLSILVHEARHSDDGNDGWLHEICPTPFVNKAGKTVTSAFTGLKLEGLDACDNTELGAYGTSAVFLKNVEYFCENCSEKVKMDAAYFARNQMDRITNVEALARLEKDLAKP